MGATGGKIGFYGAAPVTQPAGENQAAVTLGNSDGVIAGLTISDPPTQVEVQALRDRCEEWPMTCGHYRHLFMRCIRRWSRWG